MKEGKCVAYLTLFISTVLNVPSFVVFRLWPNCRVVKYRRLIFVDMNNLSDNWIYSFNPEISIEQFGPISMFVRCTQNAHTHLHHIHIQMPTHNEPISANLNESLHQIDLISQRLRFSTDYSYVRVLSVLSFPFVFIYYRVDFSPI